jgi:hypothetical protein
VIVEDQGETIAFLSRPETYGGGNGAVGRVETHVSEIFLAGKRAYKLKRAVKFPYLDFSTPGKRRAACEAEVSINRRTAPGIYRGVIPVTRGADGALRLNGAGAPVDWLVEMTRFDEDTLFDRLARQGALDRHVMEELAEAVARLHEEAERSAGDGGADDIVALIESNARSFTECPPGVFDGAKVERLEGEARRALESRRPLLQARRAEGRVRRCHGDLHLRNIFLLEGRPTLFDAIEFSEALATIDVLYDLSFLLMDLDHRDLRQLANVTLNRYLDITGDVDGLAALPLFLSLRAAIRAHVEAAAVGGAWRDEETAGRVAGARAYLDRALVYLSPPPPRLIAIAGLSGSGKSRLARELAPFVGPAPGARVVRSDIARKRLAGVSALTRLGPEGYTPAMTRRTYEAVYRQAQRGLEAGHAVIADAVFARPAQRQAIAAAAARAGVPFDGVWLEAPAPVMECRIGGRRRDASDATPEVLRRQLGYGVGKLTWARLDTSGEREDTVDRAKALFGL